MKKSANCWTGALIGEIFLPWCQSQKIDHFHRYTRGQDFLTQADISPTAQEEKPLLLWNCWITSMCEVSECQKLCITCECVVQLNSTQEAATMIWPPARIEDKVTTHDTARMGLWVTMKPVEDLTWLKTWQISSSLSWRDHIVQIAMSASKKLGILFQCKQYSNSAQLFKLHAGFIRPCLEYCSHIWGSSPYTSLLDRVESKAIRLIGDPSLTSILDPLSLRHKVASLSLFYRYYFGHCSDELAACIPPPMARPRSTRQASFAHNYCVGLSNARINWFSDGFFPSTSRLWNFLPSSVFPASVNLPSFKRQGYHHLRDQMAWFFYFLGYTKYKVLHLPKKSTSRFWWMFTFWGPLSPKKLFLVCRLCVCLSVCLSVATITQKIIELAQPNLACDLIW